jgi:hypothetical protein
VVYNSVGIVTSAVATEHLALSADQSAYEAFATAGVYELDWNLSYTITPSAPTYYFNYDYATLAVSPLTHGPQLVREQPYQQVASTLAAEPASATRVLKNGAILVVPGSQNLMKVSYVGASIQVDDLANDNTTIAYSSIRSGYTLGSLSGVLHSAPPVIQQPYNSIFANSSVLDTTTSWASGAEYMTFSVHNLGDRYNVFDCQIGAVTLDANVSACEIGMTLTQDLTNGESSASDGVTYHLSDGVMRTVGGVQIWVANNPRRQSAPNVGLTTEYRIYFQLNGNVYTGAFIPDGALEASHHYLTDPTNANSTSYLNYEMRLNKPAVDSLIAGSLH